MAKKSKKKKKKSADPRKSSRRAERKKTGKKKAAKKSGQGKKTTGREPAKKPAAKTGPRKRTPAKIERVKGTFEGHARGFGFVRPDDPDLPDVFIPPRFVGPALHGDRVEVRVYEGGRDKKNWGEVSRILEQAAEPVVGRFDGRVVVPRDPRYCARVKVRPGDAKAAEAGDIVVVQVEKRSVKGVFGRVAEVLGSHDSPGIESKVVLRAHGFKEDFPEEASRQAESAPRKVRKADMEGRRDIRDKFTITIDPERARDFDDALSIEKSGGGYKLLVSIADVSHYVPARSAVDHEAYRRATSVYLPDRAVPMLPPELSSGICSLKPEADRLAVTIEMEFDSAGRRTKASIYPSVMRSDARLSYDQVEAVENDRSLRSEQRAAWDAVAALRQLAERRRKLRLARGAVDLDVPEPEVVLDEAGGVEDILRRRQTWSHRLVEECMLAANEAVAEFMTENNQPMIYRVHEPPSAAAVEALADMLAPLGYRLLAKNTDPENIAPRDFQRVIEEARGTQYELLVKTLCLRSMMRARYNALPAGHFGLASARYCHFTSPIRRYPDLMVHRLLKAAIGFKEPVTHLPAAPAHLPAAAHHCSERERAAEDAEREMTDLYAVLWMAERLGKDFRGTVTGVTPFGLFIELEEAMVEGLAPVDTLDSDPLFIEEKMEMVLKERGERFRIGDRVVVSAESADRDQRRITFRLIGCC